LWNIFKQSYSKEFSSLKIHSKMFTEVYNPPNWNQSPSRHRAIPLSSDSWEINRLFLLPAYLIPSLPLAHLIWATKLALMVKIIATTSYSEEDYFPTILHEIPSRNDPIMVIIPSSSWLQFQLTQALEYTTVIQHFMVTNDPIMSGHFSSIKCH
jgi:hypothetical protein